MRRLLALSVILAGCGGGDPPPPVASEEGRQVVMQSGCLACHRIGEEGEPGPGPELTKVGARRSRAELRRVMREPTAPMPRYDGLSPRRMGALIDYLAGLR